MERSSSWLMVAPSQERLFSFVAADAEDEIVVGNQLLRVALFHYLAAGGIVDPLAPVPDGLEALGDLNGQVGAFGQAGAQGDSAEVEAQVEILHGDVAIALANGLGETEGHLREWGDDRLRGRGEFESSFEDIGFQE